MTLNSARTGPPIAPLFVPGNRPERFAKAAASNADAIILDLEDSVDHEDKLNARQNILRHGITDKPVFARINSRKSEYWSADIAAISKATIAGVMISKSEEAEDITAVHHALAREFPAIALVETAIAFANLRSLCAAPGLLCVAFGSLDYALDVGCNANSEALHYARSALVLECRIANLPPPLDGVTPTLNDQEILKVNTDRARALGFGGSLAIHPAQIATILHAFIPSPGEIEWANKVIKATKTSASAVKLDGMMVDKPVIERAKRILRFQSHY
ncbi:MAG TPA: CoA ester lyase [Xanthobacteraceae bacterium]|nr:CoA ester lyase [Xanthobacteraceae bacterium]